MLWQILLSLSFLFSHMKTTRNERKQISPLFPHGTHHALHDNRRRDTNVRFSEGKKWKSLFFPQYIWEIQFSFSSIPRMNFSLNFLPIKSPLFYEPNSFDERTPRGKESLQYATLFHLFFPVSALSLLHRRKKLFVRCAKIMRYKLCSPRSTPSGYCDSGRVVFRGLREGDSLTLCYEN